MGMTANNIQNNGLAALTQRAGPQVTAAIKQASAKTGVDFAYMMEKAAAESSFDTDAKARTSSAKGLYQFIESTWLQMVNRYGDKHGLGEYADQISAQNKVADPALRREILALRDDPEIASLMAGEFAAENKRTLMNNGIKDADIGPTELYLAHFLGAGAASEFIKGMQENPLTPAADIFPRAAKANKNVFYNANTQQAKSLGAVYAFFDKKFGNSVDATNGGEGVTIADASRIPSPPTRKPTPTTTVANANLTALQPARARLSPELMAYLNGEQSTYQAMQAEALEALTQQNTSRTQDTITANALAPALIPTLDTAGLSAADPTRIMRMASTYSLPGTLATRR